MRKKNVSILVQSCLFFIWLPPLMAVQENTEPIAVPQATPQESDFKTPEPQYTIHYLGVVGSTYMYQTDCCTDGHGGVLYSSVYFTPPGCGAGGELEGGVEVPSPIGSPGFARINPATDPKLGKAFRDRSFDRPATYPFVFSKPDLNACQFSNYYPDHDTFDDEIFYFGTAVRLADSDGDTCYFSLVKAKVASINSAGKEVTQEIPMLIGQRAEDALRVLDRAGSEVTIVPKETVKIDTAIKYPFDSNSASIHLVRIEIPKIDDEGKPSGEYESISVQLVNRPHE